MGKLDIHAERIISEYKQGRLTEDIATDYNCSHVTVYRLLKKHGIDTCPYKLQPHTDAVIAAYKGGLTQAQIASRFDSSVSAVSFLLIRNGVKMREVGPQLRRYERNSDFFETIDTEAKAYVLGFWYADGYNKCSSGLISLTLTDQEILEHIRVAMEYDGPLLAYKPVNPKHKPTWVLSISDAKLSSDLAQLGCGQAKTFDIRFPSDEIVPRPLKHHFLRGYFDGDGCIHFCKKTNSYSVSYISNDGFCAGSSKHLSDELGVPIKYYPNSQSAGISFVSLRGNRRPRMFLDYIYQDATIYLGRKFERYAESLPTMLMHDRFLNAKGRKAA